MLANGDLIAVKAALAAGHPVVASVRTFDWWLKTDFATGQITSPVPGDWSQDAHAVCLVGYEDTDDGRAMASYCFETPGEWRLEQR